MKFLVDAQLPVRLARLLDQRGHTAIHVSEVGLISANDSEIRNYALAHDAVVISKDEDFADAIMRGNLDVRVIWIRAGNCANPHLLEIFMKAFPKIMERLSDGDSLVEVR